MKYIVVSGVLLLSACSTYKLTGYNGPQALDRQDVIVASRECVHAKLKPRVEYVTQKTDAGRVYVPINVHCEPY